MGRTIEVPRWQVVIDSVKAFASLQLCKELFECQADKFRVKFIQSFPKVRIGRRSLYTIKRPQAAIDDIPVLIILKQ
jgi:hypothetical protein